MSVLVLKMCKSTGQIDGLYLAFRLEGQNMKSHLHEIKFEAVLQKAYITTDIGKIQIYCETFNLFQIFFSPGDLINVVIVATTILH